MNCDKGHYFHDFYLKSMRFETLEYLSSYFLFKFDFIQTDWVFLVPLSKMSSRLLQVAGRSLSLSSKRPMHQNPFINRYKDKMAQVDPKHFKQVYLFFILK